MPPFPPPRRRREGQSSPLTVRMFVAPGYEGGLVSVYGPMRLLHFSPYGRSPEPYTSGRVGRAVLFAVDVVLD